MPSVMSRASDGTVRTVFQKPGTKGQSSFRRICTISPLTIQHTSEQEDPPNHYFQEGKPVCVSHTNNHFIWDVDPSICDSNYNYDLWGDSEEEECLRKQSRKKKKKQRCAAPPRIYSPDEPDETPRFNLKKRSQKILKEHPLRSPITLPCVATIRSYD
ncbi:Polyprotein [Arachis hypogaea]|nr:Polyprotein [Arachis hypogaea]